MAKDRRPALYTGTLGIYVGDFDVYHLRPAATALLVVDMVYASAHADYGYTKMYRQLGKDDACAHYIRRLGDTVIPNLKILLAAFREHHIPIIYFTYASQEPDFSDLSRRTRRQIEGWTQQGLQHPYRHITDPDARVLDELAPAPGDLVLNKTRNSAFNGSAVDEILRAKGINLLVIVGVATNYCVQCTLLDAFDHDYECILIEDGTAALSEAIQSAAVATMRPFARIMTTAEIIIQLEARGA
jgi:nicotinamidase-related amidase